MMLFLVLLSGAIQCLDMLDEEAIDAAPDVFIGSPVQGDGETITILVEAAFRMRDATISPLDTVELPGAVSSEIGWHEVSSMVEHRDEGYLQSGRFYNAYDYPDWSDGCDVSFNLIVGVTYLFVLGDVPLLRSVEPVSGASDPWVRYVLDVIED